jgi:lipid-binding SYLF domain-containing protein
MENEPCRAAAPAFADAKRQALVNDALGATQRVVDSADFPDAANHMKKARGVLILPSFAQAAFVVGGAGGRGVLLARSAPGDWSYPVQVRRRGRRDADQRRRRRRRCHHRQCRR